jgi:hypothetical protein
MPGFRGARDIDGTYTYYVSASLDQVRSFYQREMVSLGWRATSTLSESEEFIMLVFEKEKVNVGVSITVMNAGLSFVSLGFY